MKPSNVRVAIVEPGIIDTPMAQRIRERHTASSASQRRFAALFAESLKHPVSPDLVGQRILEIIHTEDWQLRHPVGPDAIPFLEWRRGMTDEQWVDWGAADDDTWYKRVQSDFGLDARPKPEKDASKSR
jgi:hypothetical protein